MKDARVNRTRSQVTEPMPLSMHYWSTVVRYRAPAATHSVRAASRFNSNLNEVQSPLGDFYALRNLAGFDISLLRLALAGMRRRSKA